jgi:type IX secretion system PorP/SprF family membrane protein
MKKRLHIYLLIVFTGVKCISFAQDIHFSQFSMSPLNLNPAFSGFFDGDYRGAANYRSQWRSVPVSYSTFSFSADMNTDMKHTLKGRLGLGLLFNNDVAGDSKYGTNQISVPISYIHMLSPDSNFFLSVGVQPGISSVGFQTSKLTFDSQWDGDAYNPALSNGENFPLMKRTYFDCGTGMALQYRIKQRSAVTLALGLSHLNTPKISYFKNEDIQLDPKFSTYLSYTYPVAPQVDFSAEYLFEKQGTYKENIFGVKAGFNFPTEVKQSVNAGFYLRAKDALITRIGYDFKNWQFGMSYDINTSAFKAATNRKGAIEFGLICIIQKPRQFVPKQRPCPVYM